MDTRKILTITLLASVIFLTAGQFVLAANGGSTSDLKAEQANECCQLKHKITNNANEGDVVGEPNGHCDLDGDGTEDAVSLPTKDWGLYCMIDTIKTVVDWVFYFLIMAVVVMIVIGGFMYATSQGNSDRIKTAKGFITSAIIGLIIALLAKLIPSVTRFIVGL